MKLLPVPRNRAWQIITDWVALIRGLAQTLGPPGEILQRVNAALYPDTPSDMFVTCFYAILHPDSGRLLYDNAGHDLPYVRRGGDAEELRARG
jgi:serine phosphatase RsbU (regulator of sigma subunit)